MVILNFLLAKYKFVYPLCMKITVLITELTLTKLF